MKENSVAYIPPPSSLTLCDDYDDDADLLAMTDEEWQHALDQQEIRRKHAQQAERIRRKCSSV
jgi:hypothetical protein